MVDSFGMCAGCSYCCNGVEWAWIGGWRMGDSDNGVVVVVVVVVVIVVGVGVGIVGRIDHLIKFCWVHGED